MGREEGDGCVELGSLVGRVRVCEGIETTKTI